MSGQATGKGLPFRYALKPLLDWRHWQLDALKSEMASAAQVLAERRRAIDEVDEARRAALRTMAGMRSDGATLDPDADGRLRHYVAQLAQARAQRLHALDEATRLHEAVETQLRRVWQATDGLKRHRDRLEKAHRAAGDIAASAEADDAWLMSRASKESPTW